MTIALESAPVVVSLTGTLEDWLHRVRQLLEQLGLSRGDLAGKELRKVLSLERSGWIPPALSGQFVADLAFLIHSKVLDLTFNGVVVESPEEIEDGSSGKLGLTLYKERLLELLGVEAPHTWIYLFIYGEALASMLSMPMVKTEGREGLLEQATGDRKTLILLADRDIALAGPYLAVIGGSFLADWNAYCPQRPPRAGSVKRFHQRALDPCSGVSWASSPPERVTPLQLAVKCPPDQESDPVVQSFLRKWVEMSLVYTANQSREKDGGVWLCSFLGERSVGRISAGVERVPQGSAKILGDLVRWTYAPGHQESDRLTMLRSVFADAFSALRPEDNYSSLLRGMAHLNTTIRSGWDTFIKGKLREYFELRRQLEDLVEETQRSFQGHVQTLIKNMTDSMLAGVGVLVGSFLAATLGSGFNADLFRLGVLVYAVYVAFFPGLIGLRTVREQLDEDKKSYERRLEGFIDRLSEKDVGKLTEEGKIVEHSVGRFKFWHDVTAWIYAGTVLALLLAAWLVPGLV